ncbi:hypothetical protein CEXT_739371 [Caerostris extrusa]|uniref:Uncharacterized protein n=1 Tax=Caerostris extrusa TaxID=172846 RepID=A0AAV4R5M1_CAEEX|nr:hypothetical protein CEXT_739371 [Caerostris extrusa]
MDCGSCCFGTSFVGVDEAEKREFCRSLFTFNLFQKFRLLPSLTSAIRVCTSLFTPRTGRAAATHHVELATTLRSERPLCRKRYFR